MPPWKWTKSETAESPSATPRIQPPTEIKTHADKRVSHPTLTRRGTPVRRPAGGRNIVVEVRQGEDTEGAKNRIRIWFSSLRRTKDEPLETVLSEREVTAPDRHDLRSAGRKTGTQGYMAAATLLRLLQVPLRFVWTYLKVLGRPIGNRTKFGQYRLEPESGLRLWTYRMTGTRWNFGPGWSERKAIALDTIKQWKHPESLTIASFGGGGGTGKTTSASTIAQQLQETLRGVPVLLVDKNPWGTVAAVTGVRKESIQAVKDGRSEEACFTLLEASANRDKLTSFSEVQWRFATIPETGLFVLAYPEGKRLTGEDIKTLKDVLCRFFPLVIFDCPQDFGPADTNAVLETVDVVVVVTTHKDEKRLTQAAEVLQILENDRRYNRHGERVVLVINRVWMNFLHRGTSKSVKLLQQIRGISGRNPYRGVVATLPWNWRISRGRRFLVHQCSPWFRLHALELAANVIEVAFNTKATSSATSEESTYQVEARSFS